MENDYACLRVASGHSWRLVEAIAKCPGAFTVGEDVTSEARVEDAKEAYQRAKVEYERAKSEHDDAVSKCKDALNAAKRSQKKTIASLNRQVASLENDLHGKVASVGAISLYHDRLEAGGATYKLEHGLRVTVSTSGSKYSTTDVSGGGVSIGGAVVGAAIAGVPGAVIGGRKKVKSKEVVHDDRHLYVTIEGPRGGQAVSLNPDLEQQARSLASQVPGCINQYQGLVQDIPPKIKALKTKVEEAEKDDAVPTAQTELERTLNDTERLEAARQARDEARQHYHDEKKQAKTPLFGLHPHGSHDDAEEAGAEEAAEPLGEAVAFEGEQGRPAPQAKAGAAQRGRSFSGILWKILGVAVIALGIFFLLGMLGGMLDGYGIAFVLTCLVLGGGLVYLGIRLMRRGKAKP